MSEEELEKIFNNIQFQMIVEQNMGYRNEYSHQLSVKIDLYNEVIKLQDNWNELKKWLEKCKELSYEKDLPSWLNFKCMSDKMKEIESGKNE